MDEMKLKAQTGLFKKMIAGLIKRFVKKKTDLDFALQIDELEMGLLENKKVRINATIQIEANYEDIIKLIGEKQ